MKKAGLQIKPVDACHANLTPTKPRMEPTVEDKARLLCPLPSLQMPSGLECGPIFGFTALMTFASSAFRSHGFRILGLWSGRSKDSSSQGPTNGALCAKGSRDR